MGSSPLYKGYKDMILLLQGSKHCRQSTHGVHSHVQAV